MTRRWRRRPGAEGGGVSRVLRGAAARAGPGGAAARVPRPSAATADTQPGPSPSPLPLAQTTAPRPHSTAPPHTPHTRQPRAAPPRLQGVGQFVDVNAQLVPRVGPDDVLLRQLAGHRQGQGGRHAPGLVNGGQLSELVRARAGAARLLVNLLLNVRPLRVPAGGRAGSVGGRSRRMGGWRVGGVCLKISQLILPSIRSSPSMLSKKGSLLKSDSKKFPHPTED